MHDTHPIHLKSKPHFYTNSNKVGSESIDFSSNCLYNNETILAMCCGFAFYHCAINVGGREQYIGSFASPVSRPSDLILKIILCLLTSIIAHYTRPFLQVGSYLKTVYQGQQTLLKQH